MTHGPLLLRIGKCTHLGHESLLGQGTPDCEDDLVEIERLGDVIEGTEFHGLNRRRTASQHRDDD